MAVCYSLLFINVDWYSAATKYGLACGTTLHYHSNWNMYIIGIYMDESSKLNKSWTFEIQISKTFNTSIKYDIFKLNVSIVFR